MLYRINSLITSDTLSNEFLYKISWLYGENSVESILLCLLFFYFSFSFLLFTSFLSFSFLFFFFAYNLVTNFFLFECTKVRKQQKMLMNYHIIMGNQQCVCSYLVIHKHLVTFYLLFVCSMANFAPSSRR